ncbi:hypothetical protein COM64_20555 [Bacillus toyonensis]|uniref:hypothetical protein n=1 Tax=Bacillus toyonensis TaxID=155322 RepID=UPI000BF70BE9|nr:hypothetical protein [Bacillus toyonensis]PGE16345.1 hypothetical protein COM64_20555 [Bacillus toyonensis]
MSSIPYVIHIGGSLYLDSDGNVIQGPPPNRPVYEAPFEIPVDPKMVRDALIEVKDVLKDINKNRNKYHEDLVKIFNKLSVPLDLLDVLDAVGKIAGGLGSGLSVAIGLAKLFGLLKEGPSALELLVKKRFDDLDEATYSIQKTVRNLLWQGLDDSKDFFNECNTHFTKLKNRNPSIIELENDRIILNNSHSVHRSKITLLLNPGTWLSMFNQNDHTYVFGQLLGILYTMPGNPGSAPVQVTMPKQNENYFDHRLMVSMVSKVVADYLFGIRCISPEYRTTSDFRDSIKDLTKQVSVLAQLIRQFVLARTIYTPYHFSSVTLDADEVTFDSYNLINGTYKGLRVSPYCRRWPVGALDLRYHNNTFFSDFSVSLGRYIPSDEIINYGYKSTEGLMNAQWIPPAILEELPPPPGISFSSRRYIIKNPEECAMAANAQSEIDYAKLIAVSGYFELLHLEALLQHESTEPDQSQTVHCNKPSLWRNSLQSSDITVESEKILGTGIIKSNAVREPQEFFATASITTQSIKRARPVQYKIKLRTLNSITSGRWTDPEYTQFQWAQYESDPAYQELKKQDPTYPDFKKLELKQSNADLDDFTLISEWTSSPRDESIRLQGTAELTADTFDWWIPVKSKSISPFSPFSPIKDIEISKKMMISSPIDIDVIPPYVSAKPGDQDWEGEKRDLKKQKIKIDYTLEWTEDRLTVSIKNNPEYRNFVVFLVVEERLDGSGQVLHTAAPIPINGLLTYVPQKFFDDEVRALENAKQIIIKYGTRYYVERVPNPIDPIIGWLRPEDNFAINIDSINRFVQLAEKHDPELLKEILSSFEGND